MCLSIGDTIAFVEVFDFQGAEIRITYKGKVADGYTWRVWKNDLYFITQLLFQDKDSR